MDRVEVRKIVNAQMQSALWECCHPEIVEQFTQSEVLYHTLIEQIIEDALAYCKKDPASRNCLTSILQGYTSFKATCHYRLAHIIFQKSLHPDKEIFATLISNRGKLLSGAEIHYKSQIGRNFVLDHGYGTVIGETTIIGDDCYLLGGVTLGATGIANNCSDRRHPKIGSNVEIGAFSKIFGSIEIGDHVFIGPNCVITENVLSHSRVINKSFNQVTRTV